MAFCKCSKQASDLCSTWQFSYSLWTILILPACIQLSSVPKSLRPPQQLSGCFLLHSFSHSGFDSAVFLIHHYMWLLPWFPLIYTVELFSISLSLIYFWSLSHFLKTIFHHSHSALGGVRKRGRMGNHRKVGVKRKWWVLAQEMGGSHQGGKW